MVFIVFLGCKCWLFSSNIDILFSVMCNVYVGIDKSIGWCSVVVSVLVKFVFLIRCGVYVLKVLW